MKFFNFIRIILGLLFMIASFSKIFNPHDFASVIYNYQVLPGIMVATVALIIPWIELICGACLVFNILPKGASLIIGLLMLVFAGLLAFNISRGLNIACGCFTTDPEAEANMTQALIRDSAILLLSVLTIWGQFSGKGKPKADQAEA